MPHFLINLTNIENNLIIIDNKEDYHHLTRVLRIKTGQPLTLIDEHENEYQTIIKTINSNSITCEIEKQYKSFRKLDFQLDLVQSVLNSDSQNFLIQKATELGVNAIIPLYTDNCAVKKELISKRLDKWKKIAFEAFKQCERANIPQIKDYKTLKELDFKQYDKVIACAEKHADSNFKKALNGRKYGKILLIVGCEGGFSEKEFEFFEKNNISKVTLGNLILKAETAVIAGVSNLIYEMEHGCN